MSRIRSRLKLLKLMHIRQSRLRHRTRRGRRQNRCENLQFRTVELPSDRHGSAAAFAVEVCRTAEESAVLAGESAAESGRATLREGLGFRS